LQGSGDADEPWRKADEGDVPRDGGREEGDGRGAISERAWKRDVCNARDASRHCICSWSFEPTCIKPWKTTLDRNEAFIAILAEDKRASLVSWRTQS
jgi:hypothetical protein